MTHLYVYRQRTYAHMITFYLQIIETGYFIKLFNYLFPKSFAKEKWSFKTCGRYFIYNNLSCELYL